VPTYQYACTECGERTEVVQKFTDDALTTCATCGGKLRKVYSPVGIVFKGSGFYRTDSRKSSTADVPAGTPANGSGKDGSSKDGGSGGSGESTSKDSGSKGGGSKDGAKSSSSSSDSGSSSSSSSSSSSGDKKSTAASSSSSGSKVA
jgi:putative FmdB family regulatory protein